MNSVDRFIKQHGCLNELKRYVPVINGTGIQRGTLLRYDRSCDALVLQDRKKGEMAERLFPSTHYKQETSKIASLLGQVLDQIDTRAIFTHPQYKELYNAVRSTVYSAQYILTALIRQCPNETQRQELDKEHLSVQYRCSQWQQTFDVDFTREQTNRFWHPEWERREGDNLQLKRKEKPSTDLSLRPTELTPPQGASE